MEQTNGSGFVQRAASVESDVLCPESAASPASGGWFGMRPSGADRTGQPRRARWFEVAAKKPIRGFCATRTQPRSLRFSNPGIGSIFDASSRTARNPGVAKASARRRSRTGKRQEVHVAARGGSCRGKAGERAAFGPNRSGFVIVQPGAAGNRWKMVGSSVGSRGGDEWRCHGRWFLRRCEDNGTRCRFVLPWGAIAFSCRRLHNQSKGHRRSSFRFCPHS